MQHEEPSAEEGAIPSSVFTRIIGYISIAAAVVSAFLVVLTLSITGYSVFQRYVLGTPLTWTDELSGFLVVGMVMLGAAETLRRGEHISVDLLSSKATGNRKTVLGVWAYLTTAFVSAVIAISAWEAVEFSWKIGVYSDGYLEAPLWIPQSVLLFGAILLCAMAIGRLLDLVFLKRQT